MQNNRLFYKKIMNIRFYNSLTNKVEDFVPYKQGEVSMYVCGPTVYNHPHVGNMRPVVVFDTLRRFLSYVGYKVTYVSNLTDVDDKIIKAAKEEGISEKELTTKYIEEFFRVSRLIGCQLPNITPKVTEYIQEIISYIDNLVKIGAAYEIDGDVYFRVSKIEDYGALSGINVEDLKVGARVSENDKKESPLDFALWKKTSEGIQWDSPWGKGRPGWHTECCVMIDSIFPEHVIDIHGGGYDLKFPHHENEIAQSIATHGNKIARFWMHNAFINLGSEKMSKSLGNVIYAKDLIAEHTGPVSRLVILSAHYRQPVSFTDETVTNATNEIKKMQMAYSQAALKLQTSDIDISKGSPKYIEGFLNALADDLNTANALFELYSIIKNINSIVRDKNGDLNLLNDYFKTLTDMFYVLGLDITYRVLSEDDKKLYQDYLLAKQEKDFAKSDEIRNLLIERHIL